ncbi:hypothetical protein BH20ACT19_BH20ACT19_07700 [soil metagenome]
MDRDEIVAALTALGERLDAKGIEGEMYVVGGAAIALAYDQRRSTRDVDAVFKPKMAIYEAAAEVAAALGLPAAWLNDAVKGFLRSADPQAAPVLEVPGLRCLSASPRMLLALRVLAPRVGEDEADVRLLAAELSLHSSDEVLSTAEQVFGDHLEPAARFFVESSSRANVTRSAEPSRIAAEADSKEVGALLHRFNTEFDELSPGADVLEPRVREHIERDLSVFVLAGPPHVGVAQLRFRDYLFTGAPTCYLEELYVVPDQRGEGHGRALVEAATSAARGRGATTIELGTATNDYAARGLYESLGFSNLERAGEPDTAMLYYEREL